MVEMVVPMESLADPMPIRFTFKATNITDIAIYVKSEIISAPAGWAGSAEQHGSLGVGIDDYFLNDNNTKTKPATDTEQTITFRVTYYSDAGYSSELNHEDITYVITFVDFDDVGYTVLDDDGFELDLENWSLVNELGSSTLVRITGMSRSGVACMAHNGTADGEIAYAKKDFVVPAATRAYIRIWLYIYGNSELILEIITDSEGVSQKRTLPIAFDYAPKGGSELGSQWICIGLKMPTNGTYRTRLRNICESVEEVIRYDDIRVVYS